MGKEQRPSRCASRIGAFVAVMMLALAVPGIAFAANTATFRSATPTGSTKITRPAISVVVYDRYGVRGSTNYSLYLDGVKRRARITYYSGYGYRKFRLSYTPGSALSDGLHRVSIRVKDLRRRISTKYWSFRVDTVAPSTTAGSMPVYPGIFIVPLTATDGGSGVAATYYKFDGGPATLGNLVTNSFPAGLHTIEYWSVDNAGNVEIPHIAGHTVKGVHDVPDVSCAIAGCHGDVSIAETHVAVGCVVCHERPTGPKAMCTDSDCHGATMPVGHPVPALQHTVSGGCFTSMCHGTNVATMHTTNFRGTGVIPGCAACHGVGKTASLTCSRCHADYQARHDATAQHASLEAGISGTKSSACTTCHGTALLSVAAGEHSGCSCHVYEEATSENTECVDCHSAAHAPHGFVNGVFYGEGWTAASGHNTTTYRGIGAFTKWDGSEGVVVKSSTGATITQEWPLPTGAVFWSQVDPTKADPTTDSPTFIFGSTVAAKINTTVGWGSVVTCQDCHTGLSSSMGPQGANAGQVGLDPAFPDDWTTAEITSFDPTGMRSIATTVGASNRFYPKLGSRVWPPEGSSGTTEKPNVWKNGSNVGTATISEGGFYSTTQTLSNGYSAGVVEGRYICQKCHKLTSPFQGVSIAGNTRGFRSNNFAYSGFSNEVHMEHHADTINGQGNCISCHIGIPHGWKRPRLLVYESDPAPYKVSQLPTSSPVVAMGVTYPNAGNWAYFANTGASGWKGSSHLESVNAASTAHKENAEGVAGEFAPNDLFNGTAWGDWSATSHGILWHADSNVWTSEGAEGTHEIQNNCNACTATGATHADPLRVGGPTGTSEGFHPATTGEAIPTTPGNFLAPAWK